jgi:acyl-CoA hydrolase
VALDRDGKPRPVPPLIAETDEERQRQHEAVLRRQARMARKEAISRAREVVGDI